jgi:4-amino-4-deoxy-L-arabinose transferase-like glycosyltransferase
MMNPAAIAPSRVGLRMGGAGYSCALVTTAGAQRPSSAAPARPGPWPGFWPALLAIVAAAVAIRVVYTLVEAPWPPPGLDDQFYFSALPKLVADGAGWVRPLAFLFQDSSVPTAEHPPLHSVVLTGLAELGGTSPDAQRLTGSVFGAGTIVAVGVLGRRLAGDRAGLLAAGLAALYPVLITADGALMSESLFGLLVALMLLAAYRVVEAPTVGRAVVLGAVAALAALTRGEALLLLALVLVPVLRRPAGLRATGVAFAAFVVLLAPWTVRNWIAFDQPVVIANSSGSAIAGANCEATYFGDQLGGWRPQCVREYPGNEAESFSRARRDGTDYARDHLDRLPVVLAVRVARVWALYDHLQVPEGRSVRAHKLGLAMLLVLVPLAAGGALVLRRRGVDIWILFAPVVMVSLTALLSYGNQRFRQPADVALVVPAAVALDAVWGRRVASRTRASA